jgi:hypothetical protein
MSESALVRAVRDQIRASSSITDRQCDVELDEIAPPTAGDVYILVMSAGTEAGPSHNANQGARDILYSVDVSIALRAPKVPRDRQRKLFIALTQSYEVYSGYVMDQVDFKYPVNDAANAYILAETASTDVFIEVLKFANSSRFRLAPAGLFLATTGEQVAAVIRTIHFRGARRLEQRNLT